MNLLESSLIINQLLYKIYYQNNFFVFNKCISASAIFKTSYNIGGYRRSCYIGVYK